MNKLGLKFKLAACAAVALAGLAASFAWADQQCVPFSNKSGGSGTGCPGAYTGLLQLTNSAGTLWITPPTNATSGTLTDACGFATPYVSVASVKCNDFMSWCATNSVTFPATNSKMYQLTIYVKSPLPPPTNGQPMNVQIIWK